MRGSRKVTEMCNPSKNVSNSNAEECLIFSIMYESNLLSNM